MPEEPITPEQLDLIADIIGGMLGPEGLSLLPQQKSIQNEIRQKAHNNPTTRAHQPRGPQKIRVSAEKPQSPMQAAANPPKTHPPLPPPQTQTPAPQPPEDQQEIVEIIKEQAQRYGGTGAGTELAHWLKTHSVSTPIASQFEAAGVQDLDVLQILLNQQKVPENAVNLTQFHDDESPFVILSQPEETLTQGGAPAVVVGPPYVGLVHFLEEAFPGVHFIAVDELPNELERAAALLPKPPAVGKSLSRKSLRSSPFGISFYTKAEGETTPASQNTGKGKKPPERPVPVPDPRLQQVPSQQSSQQQEEEAFPSVDMSGQTREQLSNPSLPQSFSQAPEQEGELRQTSPTTPFRQQLEGQTGEYLPPEEIQGKTDFNPYLVLDDVIAHIRDEWIGLREAGWETDEELLEKMMDDIARVLIGRHYSPTQIQDAIHYGKPYIRSMLNELALPDENPEELTLRGMDTDTPEYELSDIGKALRTGKLIHWEPNDFQGNSKSYLVVMQTEDGHEVPGLFKPADEEDPNFQYDRDVPRGTFFIREIHASSILRVLGWEDLGADVTLRSLPLGEQEKLGSLQFFKRGLHNAGRKYGLREAPYLDPRAFDGDKDLARAAVVDYLFGNTDRHNNNWGLIQEVNKEGEPEEKLFLFDHAMCFPNGKLRLTEHARMGASQILNEATLERWLKIPNLDKWMDKWPLVEQILLQTVGGKGLTRRAIEMTKKRFFALIEHSGEHFATLPALDGEAETLEAFFDPLRSWNSGGRTEVEVPQKSLPNIHYKIATGPEYEPSMTPELPKKPGTAKVPGPKPIGEGATDTPSVKLPTDKPFPVVPETSHYDHPKGEQETKPQEEEQIPLTEGSILPEERFDPYKEWTGEEEDQEEDLLEELKRERAEYEVWYHEWEPKLREEVERIVNFDLISKFTNVSDFHNYVIQLMLQELPSLQNQPPNFVELAIDRLSHELFMAYWDTLSDEERERWAEQLEWGDEDESGEYKVEPMIKKEEYSDEEKEQLARIDSEIEESGDSLVEKLPLGRYTDEESFLAYAISYLMKIVQNSIPEGIPQDYIIERIEQQARWLWDVYYKHFVGPPEGTSERE